jgi:hypothetical protein
MLFVVVERLRVRRRQGGPQDRPQHPTVTLSVYAHLFGNTDERTVVVEAAMASFLGQEHPANGYGTLAVAFRWQSSF